jgi:hypothetical protein
MTTTVFLAASHCGQVIYPFLLIYGMKVICHPVTDVEHHRQLFLTWLLMWLGLSHLAFDTWSCDYLVTIV